ncbi:GTP-binding protein [Chondromyces apiculatus DSM 436]|uniref:GTPase HflX n=2 Tax=Chondromyces apiculatus TaxID=51 RepID=A0A017SW61_9BACT|nr:GTP-binding protein [Chondromyces apiculatus DSM 436]
MADLAELGRLVETLGYDVVATISQRRAALGAAAVLGRGKLRELAAYTGGEGEIGSSAPQRKDKARLRWEAEQREAEEGGEGDLDEGEGEVDEGEAYEGEEGDEEGAEGVPVADRQATLVAIDHDVSPSQLRNLERATGTQVLDRTGVIIEIFHRHARSREAKLQVEIARLSYVAPRLRESPGTSERQRGKGAGESALELDRRRIRDRIAELREELAAVQRDHSVRRTLRRDARRVALVGYTNAGKSSLMRALTASEVLVADKLFATLDTTVRALQPEAKPRILVSDTVGFIKKLPHDLVASFRSTLDEALEASLLLFVADVSDPMYEEQLTVTRSVLGEIGAVDIPSLLLLNKVDRLTPLQREALQQEHPEAVMLSAKDPADVAALRDRIVAFFEASMVEGELVLPYGKQSLIGEIYENARVMEETYDEQGGKFRLRAHPTALDRLRSLLLK